MYSRATLLKTINKTAFTLLTAFIVCLAAVAFKDVYSSELPIHNRGIRAAIMAGDLDILFIGSSTFRCDIDMPIMDEALDGRVYNISYGGNQLAATTIQYDEIKSRSDNDMGLMVFELGPMMLTEEIAISDSRVIWDLSWEGKKRLWEEMEASGQADNTLRYEYFISSGMDDLITFPITEPFYATRYYKGAKTDETPSPGREYLETAPFDISGEKPVPAQEKALKDLLEKLKKDGQNFVFLECPHYYRLQEDPVYRKYLKSFTDILDSYDADYILASDFDFDDRDPALFEDMNHMSFEGRKLYTEMLCERLCP